MLWFAFKLYLYRVLSHLRGVRCKVPKCCDLLSNCIFIEFYHIFSTYKGANSDVVICFQIVSLSSSITSHKWYWMRTSLLWFAFKLYLYRVLSHHQPVSPLNTHSCDLLSNCIFIEFYHIRKTSRYRLLNVVICFQIVSLSSSITSEGQ